MEDVISEEIKHAIMWLAAEFKYLRILHNALERIGNENLKEQEKELKRDQRVIKYISKAETRVEHNVKDIIQRLKRHDEIHLSPDKLAELIKQIKIPSDQLLKSGSYFVGQLRDQLISVRTEVDIEKKYSDEKHRKKVSKEIRKLNNEVQDLEEWLAMLSAALEKANELVDKGENRDIANKIMIESLAKKVFGKVEFPGTFHLRVKTYSEVYPDDRKVKDKYFIQMTFGSKKDNPWEDFTVSFFDIWYNREENQLDNGQIDNKKEFQGKGFGKKFEEARVQFAKILGCARIVINLNTNHSFWKKMGYHQVGEYWIKEIR